MLFVFAVFTLHELPAQTDSIQATRENSHTFTKLALEVRADFSYDANYPDSAGGFAHEYGFNGKYFNLAVGGEFGKGFSYFSASGSLPIRALHPCSTIPISFIFNGKSTTSGHSAPARRLCA